VFASANLKQIEVVVDNGRIVADTTSPFASNRLTIVTPADNPAGISRLEDMNRPGILLVLATAGVPVRQYTDEMVAKVGSEFATGFYANVVSEEENVRQVLAKVALGEADAALVYSSDMTPDVAAQVQQIPIPDAQNVVAYYPIAPLADAPHPELAQEFIAFVLSEKGQAILARWGFGNP
jgi:molybdate transport system substrate-binding protein